MFKEKTNWKLTFLKPIIYPIIFGLLAILLYFGLFAGLEGISSLIAQGFNMKNNAEIIKSTNSTFGAMLVAMATIYWNFTNSEEKDKNKSIKKKVIKLHILKRRIDKIQRNIKGMEGLLLNQNLSIELKQIFKNKLDEIKKIEDEVIEIVVEIEHFDLYKKSNLFFEAIYTERSFDTKNELKDYLLMLEENLKELKEITSDKLVSYINK
ncbi:MULTISPECIES: hypothetical protein [Bacillus]|uniref:Uncharacterized protein n=1 Tax=Bacillus thuringiensis subsp. konkukian (strain 97-27) TaxID=281309 RepID=Q6HMM7_BACHK|nr:MULTISPECIES: hypothetical protein [Bacillus cereus group]OTY49919.1 hypothetical protein BK748_26865 [Bacillus thuringiensis serovar graciosensis]AAT59208.1 conserved hypothetical protein [[Bacillus thuringiensis] serovar konkukian str. 97-27]AJI33897.1 pretranslocase subunit Sec66 family protein [Bacillus thuringiensis]KXY73049.1 hypothetical protein AT270_24360 [Bacillus cereus]MBG9939536.1 hypothetical protein [Bacillus tropicus]